MHQRKGRRNVKKNVVRLSYVIPLLCVVVAGGESRADTLRVEDEGSPNWALSRFGLINTVPPETISFDGAFPDAPQEIGWFTGVITWPATISPAIFEGFPAVFGSDFSRASKGSPKGAPLPASPTIAFQDVVSPSAGYGAIRPTLLGGEGASWKNTGTHAVQDTDDWLFNLQFAKSVNKETADQIPFLPVPEPTTGGLLLLGLAVGTIQRMVKQGRTK